MEACAGPASSCRNGRTNACLINPSRFATRKTMTIARISELDRRTTQSGKAKSGQWLLEFERTEAQLPDPLTGWAGSGDTRSQVRMTFSSSEEAIAYADHHGITYHLVPAPPVSMKIQAYADNFR